MSVSDLAGAASWASAGRGAAPLIVDPPSWINRRVETVEMLASEQTRRRVSVDYSLPKPAQLSLVSPDGVVIPIAPLTKEARRGFDLRDESGAAVPVLGRVHNGRVAHFAMLTAAIGVLEHRPSVDELAALSADLGGIVFSDPHIAGQMLERFAASEEQARQRIWAELKPTLSLLVDNYVLFAVLPAVGPTRRVLKYGYSEPFVMPPRSRIVDVAAEAPARVARPDRVVFEVGFPGAWWGASFHAEIVIPEELRFDIAHLLDRVAGRDASALDVDVDRSSLYAARPVRWTDDVAAVLVVAPERAGLKLRASVASIVVAALLWLGVVADLDGANTDAAVSLLLAGAALYSGVVADGGEHRLVKHVFGATRRWLGLVTLSALAASACLAMQVPSARPTTVWIVAAALSTVAAVRLGWSAFRAAV